MKKAFRFRWWLGMDNCAIGFYFLVQVIVKLLNLNNQYFQAGFDSELLADLAIRLDDTIQPMIYDAGFVFFFFVLGLAALIRSETIHAQGEPNSSVDIEQAIIE